MRKMILAILVLACTLVSGCGKQPIDPAQLASMVSFEGELGNSHVITDAPSEVVAHLNVTLREQQRAERPAVNIALVIDTSGSMKGAAIDAAKKAAAAMIATLRDGDRMALIAFHSKPEVLLASTELDDDARAKAAERVSAMEAKGTTDMAGGLEAAVAEVTRHFDASAINRVVLVGDGIPNVEHEVRGLAQTAGERSITITAFGLGDEYDETLMAAVAQLSGGRFHYVESPDAMLAFFEREALRLDSVLAKNTVLEITPGPGVTIKAVVGQQLHRNGPRVRVSLGDMSRGDARDLVVRLEASPRKSGAAVELIDAVLSFDDPGGTPVERRLYLGATATDREALIKEHRNDAVMKTAARQMAASETLQAIEQNRGGQGATARDNMTRAAKKARAAGLSQQADEMDTLSQTFSQKNAPKAQSPAPAEAMGQQDAVQKRTVRRVHDEAMQHLQ